MKLVHLVRKRSQEGIIIEYELTESFGAHMFVFELVKGRIRVDHNPLHTVTAELFLSLKQWKIK